jgi:protoheme IX farnesyltransferase
VKPAVLDEPASTRLPAAPARVRSEAGAASIVAALELVKLRVSLLVVFTTVAGFVLGAGGYVDPWALLHVALGTALVAGGAAAVNQFIEREEDSLMARTRERPIPSGRLQPVVVLAFGLGLAALGVAGLYVSANPLTAALAAFTFVSYAFIYTPLKKRSHLATLVGAVPGALPPLIGWAAAQGALPGPAWTLFAILFVWQLPHFLGIAWLYRDDYASGGFPMLTVIDPSGRAAGRQVFLQSLALIPVSLLPVLGRLAGTAYGICAAGLGLAFLLLAVLFAITRSRSSARALVIGSIIYLPALLVVLVLDRIP